MINTICYIILKNIVPELCNNVQFLCRFCAGFVQQCASELCAHFLEIFSRSAYLLPAGINR